MKRLMRITKGMYRRSALRTATAALLLLNAVLPACQGFTGIPLPSGPAATTERVPPLRRPVPDIVSECIGFTKYFFVDAELLVQGSITRVVNGNRVGISVDRAALLGRFHAPALNCPAAIAPTDGGPASIAFSVLYAAELAPGGTCVQRSRADYQRFSSAGLGLASAVVEPAARDQIWRQLDQLAVVPSLYAIPNPLPPGRCIPGWSELPIP